MYEIPNAIFLSPFHYALQTKAPRKPPVVFKSFLALSKYIHKKLHYTLAFVVLYNQTQVVFWKR